MTQQITCIAVEDEPLAMERMVEYIQKLPLLELLCTFDNAADAFTFLKSNAVDLIFLDINLGELSGIQLIESMHLQSEVILTTAYPDYALKGYELNVTDYLLKPFSFERFLKAVDKVEPQKTKEITHLFIKTENRLEKIELDDIVYIEGMRDYRRIHTKTKKIMTLQNFSELEKLVPTNILCRVHKSYMVAVNKISAIEKGMIDINGTSIPVSDTYKQRLYSVIGKG